MRRALFLVAIAACGPLSAPVPEWKPPLLKDPGDLVGHWTGFDRDHWYYLLWIRGDKFDLSIDRRDPLGTCTATGTLAVGAHDEARAVTALVFTYATNTCNASFAGASVTAYVRDTSWLELAWPDAFVSFYNEDSEEEIHVAR